MHVTALYFVMVVFASGLMLCVMTFNAGVLFAVVTGQFFGFVVCPKPDPILNDQLNDYKISSAALAPAYESCCTKHD